MNKISKFADIVLIGGGSACFLLFTGSVIRHGWAAQYVSLIILAVLLFASLRLRVSSKINVALLLISTAIGLYGAEVVIGHVLLSSSRFHISDWMNFPEDANSKVAVRRIKEEKSANASFDSRTRLEVVHDLRSKGIQAFPNIFPAVLFQSNGRGVIKSFFTVHDEEFLPLASIANVTTVFCNESGQYIIYQSDEHGFHNPPGLWEEGRAQIVALGDSYAHGACVPSEKGFVSAIRSRYPRTINLGINGDGPLTMLATLREYAPYLKPKVVLWFYYEGNDIRDLYEREKHSPLLKRYLDSSFSQHLIDRQPEIDQALTAYLEREMELQTTSFDVEEFLKVHHLRTLLHSVIDKRPDRDGLPAELIEHLQKDGAPAEKQDLQLLRAILTEAWQTVSLSGSRMYFVYLPTWERYRIPDLASQNRDAVLSIVNQLRIPLIDLHGTFVLLPDPLSLFPSRRYAHYNVDGHQLVGSEIVARLEKDGGIASTHQSLVSTSKSRQAHR